MPFYNQSLVIEIQKAGFINKGAELMLLAVVDRLRSQYPNIILTMETSSPSGEQPYKEIANLGIFPKAYLCINGINLSCIFDYLPRRILDRFGLVREKDIDLIIDAAGFAYSSQWGDQPTKSLLSKIKRCKKNRTKIVFLPQAFGPFDNINIAKSMKSVLSIADLVIARDKISLKYLKSLQHDSENVFIYPDFTVLLEGNLPSYFDKSKYGACIVPNHRMIDKTSSGSGKYIEFMQFILRYLLNNDQKPFILIHESGDSELADRLASIDSNIPIIHESNTLYIKGIIGHSNLLVGSRFHSLVSGLSQGIPTLGTGWSHKYVELFNDYDFPDGLLNLSSKESEIINSLDNICDPKSSKELAKHLKHRASLQKTLAMEMWGKVSSHIAP